MNKNDYMIIAVLNQKGGVGKTTTAVNLATGLSIGNKQILLIDLDPQGNASSSLGIKQQERVNTIYEVLTNKSDINESIIKTSLSSLYLIPANINLLASEIEFVGINKREFILKNKISQIKTKYDYIIIDSPPSLGILSINILVSATNILIPLQCEFLSLEGLSNLLQTIDVVKKNFNPNLSVLGILLTMYDKRNKLTEQVAEDVKSCLGNLVFQTVIPRNVKLSEAPSHGKPAIIYDHKCSGSVAYINLVKEILSKNE